MAVSLLRLGFHFLRGHIVAESRGSRHGIVLNVTSSRRQETASPY